MTNLKNIHQRYIYIYTEEINRRNQRNSCEEEEGKKIQEWISHNIYTGFVGISQADRAGFDKALKGDNLE